MPWLTRDGAKLFWRTDGDPAQPALLLLHSLGSDHTLWDGVVACLADRYHLLRPDARGHGASDAPPGDYTLADLVADALSVLNAAEVPQAAVAGVSMGGIVAMQMALEHPNRLRALAVCNSTAAMDREPWAERVVAIRRAGVPDMAELILARWFPRDTLRANPPAVATSRARLARQNTQGYAACAAALTTFDITARLPSIALPTLVVAGTSDAATPPSAAQAIAEAIPGATFATLPTGHLGPLEQPAAVAALLAGLMARLPGPPA